jgi:Mn2+/Fe2+ NRAMP family transporter
MSQRSNLLGIIGPGILLAATGVGAGDLATASFAGSLLGTGILWVVVLGAFFKYVVTEGLIRWQLSTGDTLLEGAFDKLGRSFGWLFLAYLVIWSFFVASALMSACGVILQAMIPLFDNPDTGKVAFGILSSFIGLGLVLAGGYRLFEQVMRVCIGIMFITVIVTAAFLWPGTGEVLRGLFVPQIPAIDGGVTWTVALLGGVGGTFTILCYGYWIREEGRLGEENLRICRIDLASAYVMTAVFGIAMVIIGSTIKIEGGGATLFVSLANQLAEPLGQWGKWMFLIGSGGAVFSSLLGVWQSVPYLFADTWKLFHARNRHNDPASNVVDTESRPYRSYLIGLATVPTLGLFWSFQEIQKFYAVVGATFVPFLCVGLLILNGRSEWVGERFRNRPITVVTLILILAFFAWMGWRRLA